MILDNIKKTDTQILNAVIDCIVLNYNDADTTISMVQKIRNYNIISHIIIVDNNSSDDSYRRLQRLASNKIILLKRSDNGGYGAGNNTGVIFSKEKFNSKYAIIANPDVEFEEKCIVELATVMDADTKCIVTAPIQLSANREIIPDFAWPLPKVWQTIFSTEHFLQRIFWKNYGLQWLQNKKDKGIVSAVVDCVPGAMIMVRSEEFCKISGYDERNFLYWEEEMLGKKVIHNGYYSKILLTETYIHNHAVTINKSIPKAINRIKLLIRGRYHFLENYTKANKAQLFIARLFFRLCFIEESIIARGKKA